MDQDQKIILFVYSLYSSEEELTYIQYTAALVIFYHLMKKGYLPYYHEQLLLYDYNDSRRYLWEDKKFMKDINIVRDFGFLSRSRVKTVDYRDINSHQCTKKGFEYLKENNIADTDYCKKILNELKCKCGNILQVKLSENNPELVCRNLCQNIVVEGFLQKIQRNIDEEINPAFI